MWARARAIARLTRNSLTANLNSYQDLIDKVVCDRNKVHDTPVWKMSWTWPTERTSYEWVVWTELVTDFIDLLLNQIDILTTRSYIVKSQAQ